VYRKDYSSLDILKNDKVKYQEVVCKLVFNYEDNQWTGRGIGKFVKTECLATSSQVHPYDIKSLFESYLPRAITKLKISIIRGKDFAAFDIGNTSDPYVIASWSTKKSDKIHKTKVHQKTLNPFWMETFNAPYTIDRTEIFFLIYDRDTMSDDFMGMVMLDMRSIQPGQKWHKLVAKTKKSKSDGELKQKPAKGAQVSEMK
jgi:Ca2+-dependent lipid-binding protein